MATEARNICKGNPMELRTTFLLIAAVLGSIAASTTARADSMLISDVVTINGVPYVFPEGANEYFPNFAPDHSVGARAVVFYEDASLTVVSDQIWTDGHFFSFASGPSLQDLQALGIPVFANIVETGGPQDISVHFTETSVIVQSDVETNPVPEPWSLTTLCCDALALASFGLLRVVSCRWRIPKQCAAQ